MDQINRLCRGGCFPEGGSKIYLGGVLFLIKISFFGRVACGILAPQPVIEPVPPLPALEALGLQGSHYGGLFIVLPPSPT